MRVDRLNGILVLAALGMAPSACSGPNPASDEKGGNVAASTSSGAEKPSPLLQWHIEQDRLTGAASEFVQKIVVLDRAGQARMSAGCDKRGYRKILISFFNFNDAPLAVQQVEATRLITSTGAVQNYSPAIDGNNTIELDLFAPNGKSHPDTYGEVLDDGIPQRLEIPLADGEKPVIDFDNHNPLLRQAFQKCPAEQSKASYLPDINRPPVIENATDTPSEQQ